ncbi:MAG: methylenetetrahydrofolate reductase, partial [Alphaproteobacteria bacterium]
MLPIPADDAPSPRAAADAQDIAATAAELVACGSLEMGADAPEDAQRIAALLPAGTPVYVNHLPRRELAHTLPALVALSEAGLEPVPHVAARRIVSRAEVEAFLKQAVRLANVRKVLLIGGDVAEPLGPYVDGAALMRDGLLPGCGVQQVGLPGYPEGHPRIASATLAAALAEKLALARAQGLGAYVVTQFSFAPNRIVEYCADLARRAADVPVYVGLPGPTSPRTLLRYAQRCGVGASLRAL